MGQALKRRTRLGLLASIVLALGLLSTCWAQAEVDPRGQILSPNTADQAQAGHWLDLAEQARQQGDQNAALEFLDTLEERHAPLPPGIAQFVQDFRAALRQKPLPSTPAPVQHTTVAIGLAHDSNINGGLAQDNLTLTLPQTTVQLPVAPASLARSGSSVRLQVLHQRAFEWANTPWSWLIHLQSRGFSAEPTARQQELITQLQTPLRIGTQSGQLGLGWSQHERQNQTQSQVQHVQWRTTPQSLGKRCDTHSQLQAEWRHQNQAPHLDSQWTGYRYSLNCSQHLWRMDPYLHTAYESARHSERPGGDTRHLGWGLHLTRQAPLGLSGHSLRIGLSQLYSTDTRGYHPLLSGNQSRTQNRTDAQMHWSAPLSTHTPWRWSLQLQSTRQASNLALFRIRNQFLEWRISRSW